MRFGQFFQETDGSYSMTRLCLFIAVAGTLLVWGVLCFIRREMIDPAALAVVHASAFAGKVGHDYVGKMSTPAERDTSAN
jgi:hypothetical protein